MPRLDPSALTTPAFDCYGTLIDWEAGTIEALRLLLARHGVTLSDGGTIAAAQDTEAPLCQAPFRSYREVLAGVVDGFGWRYGFSLGERERGLLAGSVLS